LHRYILTSHFRSYSSILYTEYMAAGNELAYIPAFKGYYDPPLGRYFPPLPRGVVSEWLEDNTKPGDLILDPLGANPMSAIEAARNSRRMLFARNNPVIWLILEALAFAPSEKQTRGIVSKLLLSRQMDETLDDHLQSVYATDCLDCGRLIQPQGFIWEQNTQNPVAKVYTCPHCGDSGERPASDHDFRNLERLGKIGLHRMRAFQRVMQGGDYEKDSIESALNCYLPRAIYVTMLLVNRLDGLVLKISERKLLQAILVVIFDDATSLWHWPEKDHRHLQLSLPSRFIEKNLWLSLENAPKTWVSDNLPVPITYWPMLPPREGGICLYQRRLADQKNLIQVERPVAIVSVFPRPNQAFWTLSALWSGWLWGRKGVIPMRSALSRRRYDWHWFAQAINASYKPLVAGMDSQTRVFGLFPQVTANFYLGLQSGMSIAGFKSVGAAYRPADDLIQCKWELTPNHASTPNTNLRSSIGDFLNSRGEPANFIEIVLHCLTEIALASRIPAQLDELNESLFSQVQEEITEILRDEHFVQIYKSNLPGGSKWWLCDTTQSKFPLSERVENCLRGKLIKDEFIDKWVMERQVCSQFPGSLTPSAELIRLCLESYADPALKDNHLFQIQPIESLVNREADITEMRSTLSFCAKKLGIIQESDANTLIWKTQENQISYRYFFTITSSIAEIVLRSTTDESVNNVVFFPGSRSRLIAYRFKNDPRLESITEQNWHFVKFRTLHRLAQNELLTIDLWNKQLYSDPPLWDPPAQFQLF
jgi:hypothetical protein